ncbi:unnamed protein product [Calypogeia fissa]
MDVNGRMAPPDVNGSTAESQHHGNGHHHHHLHHHQHPHQQGYTLFLGPDMGSGGLGGGSMGGAGGGEAGGGGRSRREFRRTNWTVGECLVLQEAKREDYERQTTGGAKEKHRTAAERWLAVEDFCWALKVHRSGQQCKDRWEKMSTDFKKVFDYERHATTGQTSFWQMTLEEKKAKRLPSTFFLEVYKGLAQWFGRGGGGGVSVGAAGGSGGGTPLAAGFQVGGARVGGGGEVQPATANGNHDNLGSLLREREGASGKAGSNGNYSGSEEGGSDEPAMEPMFDSSSGKKRNSEGDVLMSDRNGGTSGRDYRRTNWTLPESIVLQAAKREDLERLYGNGQKERHLSAVERWQVVEDYCWAHGVRRSGQQCRDRWDKLSSDFKKISDYEKQFSDPQQTYWNMTPETKKSKRLPSTFWVEVYTAMSEWFGKNRNADLRVVIHDASRHAPREASGNNEDFFGTDNEGSDPGSAAPVIDSGTNKERKSDADVLLDGGGHGRHEREYRKTNWTLQECMVLQAAKQERRAKEKQTSAEEDTWQAVEDFCWCQDIYRSGQQCKERWERMSVEFKKIYNYERRCSDVDNSYWVLTAEERKDKRLPLAFWREVFNAMIKWYTKERISGAGNTNNDLEAPHQEGSGRAGSNEDFSDADEGESDPMSDTNRDSRYRKKRKSMLTSHESLVAIMEQSRLETQKIMLDCEDRKDRRLEKSIEADVQRLEKTLESNERIAFGYCQAFVALADAIRSVASSGSRG